MGDIKPTPPSFKYLEDARQYALDRPGNEAIVKKGDQYAVLAHEDLEQQQDWVPDFFKLNGKKITTEIADLASQGSAPGMVEFLFDSGKDGAFTPDRRFTLNDKAEVQEAQYSVNTGSAVLRSPELRGLEILRKAILEPHTRSLLHLTPTLIDALRSSDKLTPEEGHYLDTHLNTPEAREAQNQIKAFLGPDAALSSAGIVDYELLLTRLNAPQHKDNLDTLKEIAKYPERFRDLLGEDPDRLTSLAQTFQELPGFRRSPNGVTLGKEQQRTFDNALRTIDQYKYKARISQEMQFNREGVASHNTELSYRLGGQVLSLGFSGRNYDLNAPFQGVDFNSGGDVMQRLRLGYSTGAFDLQLGVARKTDGGFSIDKPESQAVDRYLGRKSDEALDWAKEHKWIAAGVVAGAAATAYAYSKANPDAPLAMNFNQRFDLIDREFIKVKGEVSPEISIKDGQVDLGVGQVGIGASGNIRNHFYDATIRQRFENTTLRSGDIDNKETDLNLRYGYGNHSVMIDSRYTYATDQVNSQLSYRRNFTHSASFSSYVQPYVQVNQANYSNSGIQAGMSKDFGGGLQGSLNAGYDQNSGASAGFRISKQFNW